MTEARPISEDDLQAYVDRALDADRHEQVRRYLERHPETAARVAVYEAQRDRLRAALAPIAEEPIPAELGVRAMLDIRRARGRQRRLAVAAAMVLCLGGTGGWFVRGAVTPSAHGVGALAEEALDNYAVYALDRNRPVEIASRDQAQFVRWASNRLRVPVGVPDLSEAGYSFLGGRLVTTPNGPAAMLIYETGAAERLSVLVRPMAIDKNAHMNERSTGALDGVTWADDGIGFSLVAPRSTASLEPLAREVRRQARAMT